MTYVWMMKYRKATETYNGLTEKQWFAAAFEGRHPWKCRSYEERLARQERYEAKARLLQAKRDLKAQQEELLALQTRRAQQNPDHIRSRLRCEKRGSGAACGAESGGTGVLCGLEAGRVKKTIGRISRGLSRES